MRIRTVAVTAAVAVMLSLAASWSQGAAPPPLKQGDLVIFLGDSITAGALRPDGYITLIKGSIDAACKGMGIETIGAGVSGNKVPNLQARLEKDVLAKKPTIVFIYIGINDVWHWKKQPDGTSKGGTPIDQFEAGLREIIGKIKAAGARVILCTPSVIGEKVDGANERDKMLDEYSGISRKVARETGSELVDLRQAFVAYLKVNNKDNKDRGVLTGDSVHLNAAGNRFVAEEMLKALGVPFTAPPPPAEKK